MEGSKSVGGGPPEDSWEGGEKRVCGRIKILILGSNEMNYKKHP